MDRGLFTFLVIALLCCVTACRERSSDDAVDSWTIFRGDASLSGYTDRELPDEPVLRWCFQNNVRTVASPIIYNGTAFTCDRNGVVCGIDAEGNQCFKYDLQTIVEAPFLIRDSVMYIGRIDGYVTALSLREKKMLWSFETEGQISASSNYVDGKVLVGSYDGNMYTLDSSNGNLVSHCETNSYINGAAALWNEYMVFGGCDAWLRVVNTMTGESSDSLQMKAYIPASPAIVGDFTYVSDNAGNVYEIHLEGGKIKDHRILVEVADENEEEGGSVSIPAVSNDAIFLFNGDRYICALDRKDGHELWRKMLKGNTGESSPLVCKDKLLVCTKNGHVSIFNTTDGKELWHYEAGEQIISSPAVIEGAFYILTSRG